MLLVALEYNDFKNQNQTYLSLFRTNEKEKKGLMEEGCFTFLKNLTISTTLYACVG